MARYIIKALDTNTGKIAVYDSYDDYDSAIVCATRLGRPAIVTTLEAEQARELTATPTSFLRRLWSWMGQ